MLISIQHKINIHIKRILIIQLGDIGDVVWAIPAFRAIKAAFPQAELSILTRAPNGELLLDDHEIDKVIQVTAQSMIKEIRFIKNLRREKFDLAIDLRADDRGAFTAYLSGAPMRAALYYPGLFWRNRLFTHLVVPEPAKEKSFGAAEQSLKIIRGLGIKGGTAIPGIHVTRELKDKMVVLITEEKISPLTGWVSINPFSRWTYKEWDMEKWRQVALFIWKRYALPAVIIGSDAEAKRAAELVAYSQSPIYNLAGKTTLRELSALLQMSRLHIGVDSAAPHIAAAVGTATLTIYGPTDWEDWAPRGDNHQVILPEMECSPCHRKGCDGKGRSLCLDSLDVAKVQSAVEKMMND
jgi:ADP-heptose:LPS heptosyltransferase